MNRIILAILMAGMIGTNGLAQDKPVPDTLKVDRPNEERPLSYYKLEYVFREVQDGKTINSRSYMMTVENNDRGETKTGARVPVPMGPGGLSTQYQYMDVGINISCRVTGRNDFASVRTSVDISSFAKPEQESSLGNQVVVRSMRTEMAAVVPLGKQTLIGSIDDVNSTKRYEISLTATRMK